MAFNITPANLSDRVGGLAISAITVPNTTTVQDIIATAEALVIKEAEAVGVSNYTVGDNTYIILRSMALYKACSEVLISKNRGDATGVSWYLEEYARLLGTLRHRPQSIDETSAPQSVRIVTAGGTPGREFGEDRLGYLRRFTNRPIGY